MAHLSGHDFFLAALRAARFSNLLYNMLVKTQSSSSDITQKTQSSLSELLIGSNPLSLIGSNSPNSSDTASNGSIHILSKLIGNLVVPQDKIKLTVFRFVIWTDLNPSRRGVLDRLCSHRTVLSPHPLIHPMAGKRLSAQKFLSWSRCPWPPPPGKLCSL